MSKTAALITSANVEPYLDLAPDITNMTNYCEKNGFRIASVLVNKKDLTNHPKRDIYTTKKEYRQAFVDFMTKSPEDFLIYYYTGHGTHYWNEIVKNNLEAMCILDDSDKWYKDVELTEDIDAHLPAGKTLYVVLDTCHSGGMINAWQLDTRLEKSIVFFCGSNTEIYSQMDQREGYTGSLFTNSFLAHAKIGHPIWEIADNVLVEIFKPALGKQARSPSVHYSRPAVAVQKFCQISRA